jgi:diguanylate cyclase (GGDEF)-like protein
VILNVDAAHLGVVAERVRALIAETRIPLEEDYLRVSVSIGATQARPDDSPETLLHRADRLMYQCKMEGRNRVCLESP